MSTLRERAEALLYVYGEHSSQIEIDPTNDETVSTTSTCQQLATSQARKYGCQQPSTTVNKLLSRLQAGSRWIGWIPWLEGDVEFDNDQRFIKILELWISMEQMVRQVFGYEGCIFGPGETCPEESPVRCDACVGDSSG
jgi:hypothetical protein